MPMQTIMRTRRFVVMDDVLPAQLFAEVLEALAHETFTAFRTTFEWSKLWRTTEGIAVTSNLYHANKGASGSYMDVMAELFRGVASQLPDLIASPWKDIEMHAQRYPRGTRVAWHVDARAALGAFTFYCHREWDVNWGGELLLSETGLDKDPVPERAFHFDAENKLLMEKGMGWYVVPKPNRLVLTLPGVMHSVARVDPDAGDHMRTVVVGFLIPPDAPEKKP